MAKTGRLCRRCFKENSAQIHKFVQDHVERLDILLLILKSKILYKVKSRSHIANKR